MNAALEYQLFIQESRRKQLANDAAAVRGVERLLRETLQEIQTGVRDLPRGMLGERYRRDLLAALSRALDRFRDRYKDILDSGMSEAITLVLARETDALKMLTTYRGSLGPNDALKTILDTAHAATTFAVRRAEVLEKLYTRVFPDGQNLSGRLLGLDGDMRRQINEVVFKAVAAGQSARGLARDLEPLLTREGVDNARYRALRIARTEINTAYREGHIAAVTGPDGKLKSYVEAIGWRLSPSHPKICICDIFASQDIDGLGAGNYLPGNVPSGHPHCLCYTVSILSIAPEYQFVAHEPHPEDVPESQIRYYGVQRP